MLSTLSTLSHKERGERETRTLSGPPTLVHRTSSTSTADPDGVRRVFVGQGEFRFAHSRLITNAEEIAFYGGHEIERNILNQRYNNLARHADKSVAGRWSRVPIPPRPWRGALTWALPSLVRGKCSPLRIYKTRIWFNMFEDMLLKYAWSTIGLFAQAVPVFWPEAVLLMDATRTMQESDNVAKRTEKYITNRRYARVRRRRGVGSDEVETCKSDEVETCKKDARVARIHVLNCRILTSFGRWAG